MDYRRRSRSRSPDRHRDSRRKRSRSRSPERRYHNDSYNNDRSGGRRNERDSSRNHDTHTISASVQDQMTLLKQKASNKLAKEQLKQERLALIKNITETDNSKVTTAVLVCEGDNDEINEEAEMQKLLGFGGFNSTKGKEVADNHAGAVAAHTQREYRQYMNRKGGFNRPLERA